MLIDAYQTTACMAYDVKKIVFEINKATIVSTGKVEDSLVDYEGFDIKASDTVGWTENLTLVVTGEDIPTFAHPLVIDPESKELLSEHPEEVPGYFDIYIDVRPYISNKRGEFRVTSSGDFEFSILRASLESYWVTSGPEDIASVGSFPVTAYARWVAEAITRRMALDAQTQMDLTILAAFFYLCQLRQSTELTETDRIKMGGQIARATNINAEVCINRIESLPHINRISSFIELAKETIDNVRLEKLNTGLLVAVTSGGWFGANAQEILAVGLEHPPTFLAVLYASLNNRSYHRSHFAKNIQALDRKGAGKEFTYNLKRLPKL